LRLQGVKVLRGDPRALDVIADSPLLFSVVIGSTRTSAIPGISIAGPTPEATLLTPTLDVEYLVAGKPLSLDAIPVTPEGIPTPALLTRASLGLAGDVPVLVVDAGAYRQPLIPHVALPSRRPGEAVSTGRALPPGTARRLYNEARTLGRQLGRGHALVIGESIPGGTTTAMAIMEGLGLKARGLVSSAGPENPHELKWRVVSEGLRASGLTSASPSDPFRVVDSVGDPVHVSIAGMAAGALEAGARLVALAGGTQMAAVAALLSRLGVKAPGRLALLTTRWLVEDPTSDLPALLDQLGLELTVAAALLDFSASRFEGLRYYERGYVKEGVGAGGAAVVAMARRGVGPGDILRAVELEYERLTGARGGGSQG
jgi:uncharacterized protein (TIGR00303 family)